MIIVTKWNYVQDGGVRFFKMVAMKTMLIERNFTETLLTVHFKAIYKKVANISKWRQFRLLQWLCHTTNGVSSLYTLKLLIRNM